MARTQENRQAELITGLGPDKLLFHRMVASEGVSQLFDYDLLVLSEDENIELNDLVGQHVQVELELPHDEIRYFCGHVTRFSFLGFSGNLAKYQVRLRPWLWFLTRTSNSRIFQNMSVPDIIKNVCGEHGFTDIDERLTEAYDPREYCVQYRESDFAFISRLMEEEGISYFFVHVSGKHDLVLADSISAHEPFGDYDIVPWFPPDQHDHRERDHLDNWQVSRAVRSGKYTMRDYNFESPKANLEVKSQITRAIEHGDLELYDYPGDYQEVGDGEDYVRRRMEEVQADFEILRGSGNARGLQPGHLFKLEQYPRDDQNREYLILTVNHEFVQDEFDSASDRGRDAFDYSCSVTAMPSTEVLRPRRATPRPIVHGPQTAVVVGDSGEEIWTDEYGRIKVQFHWDRLGGKDENSSCWVRVSQSWAGKKWGAQFLPRIGHEVIVEFMEGDPDRPIITGSVYNADNKPPYDLPANATQSGIKTRSSKSGTQDNYNEIRFEDKKGSEQLYIHAEKDMDSHVENNQTHMVDANRTTTIGRNDTETVHGDRARNVDGKEDVTIIGDWTQKVAAGELSIDVQAQKLKQISTGLDITSRLGVEAVAALGIDMKAGTTVDVMAGAGISMTAGGGIDITAVGPINISSPPGVKIVHNDHQDIGLIRKEIEAMHERVTTLEKSTKATSESHVGVSLSQVGVEFSNKGVSSSITQLTDNITNFALGYTNVDITVGTVKIDNNTFHTIG